MKEHLKAIVAFLSLTGTWLTTSLTDGTMNSTDWIGLTGVLVGTLGVYQVTNAPHPGN